MVNYELRSQVDASLRFAERIGEGDEKLARNRINLRDMLRYDYLMFLGFLFESDGTTAVEEVKFVNDYLGFNMDVVKFIGFVYDRCRSKDFINTPPKALMYAAKADLTSGDIKTMDGRPIAKFIVDTFNNLGAEFVSINGATTTELSNLSNYTIMLNNFLKEYGLYYKDGNVPNVNQGMYTNKNKGAAKTGGLGSVARANAGQGNAATEKKAASKTDKAEKEKTLEELYEELNSLVGLDSVKQDLTNLINLVKVKKIREERGMKQPDINLHLVFSGNPGTGKTTVARLLAKIYKQLGVVTEGQLVEVDRSNLVAGYVGQTATKTMEVIDSAMGGILFIDEAYTLIKEGDEKDFGQEAVDTLLKRMEDDRDSFIVIVAGYTEKMEKFVNSNPGLKSRFNKYIFFKDYTGPELYKIFQSMCSKQEYEPDEEASEYIKEYLVRRASAHEENFANAREVRNYIERCISRQATRIVAIDKPDDKVVRTFTIDDVREDTLPVDEIMKKSSTDKKSDKKISEADAAKLAEEIKADLTEEEAAKIAEELMAETTGSGNDDVTEVLTNDDETEVLTNDAVTEVLTSETSKKKNTKK
ncbi:MAG: AAA family ATPase [Eubacterium sp.]|nr:AAA family ATPase [Eubacterium sp.]